MNCSVLHATYHRAGGPLEVKNVWLSQADHPESIEYIFAMDSDDETTVALTRGHKRTVSPPMGGAVTAVRNWNAAAAAASGDLLIVIADDLFPPEHWDTQIAHFVRNLDMTSSPFALKISDSPGRDSLLRHPIVSRAFYLRHGLFSASYTGVYCDDDLSLRAYWRAIIIDGHGIEFEHRHPSLNDSVLSTESHLRINAEEEYIRGREVFRAKWNWFQRVAPRRLVDPHRVSSLSTSRTRLLRAQNYTWSSLMLVRACFVAVRHRLSMRRRSLATLHPVDGVGLP